MSKGTEFFNCYKSELVSYMDLRLDPSKMSVLSVLLESKEGNYCELVFTIVNICRSHIYVSWCKRTNFNIKLLCNSLIR